MNRHNIDRSSGLAVLAGILGMIALAVLAIAYGTPQP